MKVDYGALDKIADDMAESYFPQVSDALLQLINKEVDAVETKIQIQGIVNAACSETAEKIADILAGVAENETAEYEPERAG